jgi:ADP-ribose pyrophosphatase YjhB (NUDIX family)
MGNPSARDSFCSYCGTAFEPPLAYPRTCPSCKTQIWANPIPVSVVLLPVVKESRTGLLVIRRGIQPGLGKLALVGGFLEDHETWAQGGARELREETGVNVDAQALEPFWFTSTEPRPNRVLLFSTAKPVEASALDPFAPDHETTERGVVFGPSGLADVFAFPLHVTAARRFFEARSLAGAHAYETI